MSKPKTKTKRRSAKKRAPVVNEFRIVDDLTPGAAAGGGPVGAGESIPSGPATICGLPAGLFREVLEAVVDGLRHRFQPPTADRKSHASDLPEIISRRALFLDRVRMERLLSHINGRPLATIESAPGEKATHCESLGAIVDTVAAALQVAEEKGLLPALIVNAGMIALLNQDDAKGRLLRTLIEGLPRFRQDNPQRVPRFKTTLRQGGFFPVVLWANEP